MYRVLNLLFTFFLTIPQLLPAQILPREGSELNYRRIGFSFPAKDAIIKYKTEIADGHFDNDDSFKKHITTTAYSTIDRTIATVPKFGNDYTWRVTYTRKNKTDFTSPLYHFRTGYVPSVDTNNLRLRILKPAVKYKDDFVFVDGNNVLYDMKGNPVWYYPYNGKNTQEFPLVRDLKVSPQGTITFLLNQHAFEINYNGDTLWNDPRNGAVNGEDTERYHHEFTRLSNGHYMVLGTEHVIWDHKIIPVDTSFSITVDPADKTDSSNPSKIAKTPFGTIIEYNEQGNVVWSWKSSNYFLGSDLANYMPEGKTKVIDVHENSFFFDERDSTIYISYRNISRILKIKYPQGNVLNSYGETFKPGMAPGGNGLFSNQHAVKKSKHGYLYLYNNNPTGDSLAMPKVIILKERPLGHNSLVKIWEYDCSIDGINMNQLYKKAIEKRLEKAKKYNANISWKGTMFRVSTGGNVIELPDRSMFICMNSQYSKLLIVSRDKKLLWSATPEKLNPPNNEWYLNPHLYRASIVTPKELDQLIYNGMKAAGNRK